MRSRLVSVTACGPTITPTIALGSERRHCPLDLVCVMHTERHQLDLERRGQGFSRFEVPDVGRRLGMHHEPDAFDLGRDSLSSSSHFPLIAGESQLANPVRLPLGRALLLTNIYSTTSSAIASNPDGILISSARAVCKLM